MKRIVLIVSLFALALTVQVSSPIRKGNKIDWKETLLFFAEVQSDTKGPLDQLLDAIHILEEDLEVRKEDAIESHEKRTQRNREIVDSLNSEILSAQEYIADKTQYLQTVLYPTKSTLENSIQQNYNNINKNKNFITETTFQRKENRAKFEKRIIEIEDAIDGVDESTALLNSLIADSMSMAQTGTSVIQIVKTSLAGMIQKIQAGSFKDTEISMAEAEIKSSDYTDSAATAQVLKLITNIRKNLVNAITTETQKEEKAQKDFEADVAQKKIENINFTTQVLLDTDQLAVLKDQIEDLEVMVNRKKVDLIEAQESLDLEKNTFEQAIAANKELLEQLDNEIDSCGNALEVLKNTPVSALVEKRQLERENQIIEQN